MQSNFANGLQFVLYLSHSAECVQRAQIVVCAFVECEVRIAKTNKTAVKNESRQQ